MTARDVPRLLTLGETMALVTPRSAEPLASADEVRLSIGGAESNVAMHAAALGVHTAWVGALGDDALGVRVRTQIAAAGVDMLWVRTDASAPTGVYFKDPGRGVLYYRRGSAASHMTAASVAAVPFEQADIVHLTGITPALSASCAAMVDAVITRMADAGGILSLDVNHRAALWAAGDAPDALLALAQRADLVFVGLDEAESLWGTADADAVRAVLDRPARLVVKDGAIGATEFARGGGEGADGGVGADGGAGSAGDVRTFEPAVPTEVVEPVGAGDAFAAGYLVALLQGAPARERLAAGHRRAHLVLGSTNDVLPDAPHQDPAHAHPALTDPAHADLT